MSRSVLSVLLASVLCAPLLLSAAEGQGQGRRPPPPPQEALDACEDLAQGDACSFEGKNGAVEGTCFSPDDAHPLACRPAKPPKGGGQGPEARAEGEGQRCDAEE